MLNIAIIGYGYWGPNLVRNFMSQKTAKVTFVVDSRSERLQFVESSYPTIKTSSNINEVLSSPEIDAVVIATPVFTHFKIAKQALENGKHVLIEKPMTSTTSEALELMELAERKNLTIMVDHTFLYTGAVIKMKELIDADEIGKLQYFDSTRINLGLFQPDVNVLWDLAPHDISILSHIFKEKPFSVNATGVTHTKNGIENIAYLTLNYNSDFIAHFNCSWTSPVKIRSTLIGGDKKMILFNDLEPSEKIRIYDTGFKHQTDEDKNRIRVDYRNGDVFIPKLPGMEALFGVAQDFIDSVIEKRKPIANAELGYKVVRILEASQQSIKGNGKEVKI